jgi:hypothetical protein
MPQGVETFVDEGFASISVPDTELRAEVLGKILAHTPAALIEKDTRTGRNVVYRIPEGNARAAGLIDGPTDANLGYKQDTGFSQDLVDADPQVTDRGDSWGEYRTILPTVADTAYQAMPTAPGHGVQDGDLNFTEPTDANGKVRGPLRPNKNVDSNVPQPPAGASTTAAALQAKIRDARPATPTDLLPTRVPRNETVPHAQATIASVVNRAPEGPSEPATGIGIGPNAGRVVEGQPGGEAGDITLSAPDIITQRRQQDTAISAPSTTTGTGETVTTEGVTEAIDASSPAPIAAKKEPAKKAPAKKAAPRKAP